MLESGTNLVAGVSDGAWIGLGVLVAYVVWMMAPYVRSTVVRDAAVHRRVLVVVTGERLDFGALQMRLHPAPSRIKRLSEETPAGFAAFDEWLSSAIEWAAAQEWCDGNIGMSGGSYGGCVQWLSAPLRSKYLKAIVPTASVGSQYDWNFMDGVPWAGQPLIGNAAYLFLTSLIPGNRPAPQHYPEKMTCQGEVMASSADQTGDYTQYWQDREYRPGAPIGWHKDRREFGDVVGISLVAPAPLRFRRRGGKKWQRFTLAAEPRSLYLLRGAARTEWEHSIPPVAALRYSITLRTLR